MEYTGKGASSEDPYIILRGDTTITSNKEGIYATHINNSKKYYSITIESGCIDSKLSAIHSDDKGNINIGKKDEIVNEKPILKSPAGSWTISAPMNDINFYDGKLIGGKNNIIAGSIEDIETNKEIISNMDEEELEELTLGNFDSAVQDEDTGITYNNLTTAIENTEENDGVVRLKLLKNINITDSILIKRGRNVEIDFGGKQIIVYKNGAIKNLGNLKLKNTVDGEEYNILTSNTNNILINGDADTDEAEVEVAKMEFDNVKIYYNHISNFSNSSATTTVYDSLVSGDHLALNYGEIVLNDIQLVQENYGGFLNSGNGKLTMKSGNIDLNYDTIGIIGTDNSQIVVESGKIEGKNREATGIYSNSSGKIEIKKIEEKDPVKFISLSANSSGIYSVNNASNIEIEEVNLEGRPDNTSGGNGIYSKGNITANKVNITNHLIYGVYGNNVTIDYINSDGKIDYAVYATGESSSIKNAIIKSTDNGMYIKSGIIDYADINVSGSKSVGINCIGNLEIKNIKIESSNTGISTDKNANLVIDNCDINITSNKGTGILVANNSNTSDTVTIKSGTVTSANIGISVTNQGTVILGEKMTEEERQEGIEVNTEQPFINATNIGIKIQKNGRLEFYDGKIVGKTDNSISGGVAENEYPYQVKRTNDETTLKETAILVKIALFRIDDTTECYSVEELQKKINEFDNNTPHKIDVIDDIYISESTDKILIPTGTSVEFDLNGKTIEASNEDVIENNGTMTLLDSSEGELKSKTNYINAGKNGILIKNTGTMVIKDIVIKMSGSGGENKGIVNEGTLTVNNSFINASVMGDTAENISNISSGHLIINSGEIRVGCIDNKSNNNLDIKGGTITANKIKNSSEGTLTISDTCSIQMNGSGQSGISNLGTGKLIISGGSIPKKPTTSEPSKATQALVYASNGTIEIKGATIYSVSVEENAELLVDNGEFEIDYILNYGTTNIVNGTVHRIQTVTSNTTKLPILNIKGGKIEAKRDVIPIYLSGKCDTGEQAILNIGVDDDNVNKDSPQIIGGSGTYTIFNSSNAIVNFYDGTISSIGTNLWSSSYIKDIADDYQIKMVGDGDNYSVYLENKNSIVSVNSVEYSSLSEAIGACGDGECTIQVLRDFVTIEENIEIPKGKDIVIDLNGKQIYFYGTNTIFVNRGTFKFKDMSDVEKGCIYDFSTVLFDNINKLECDIETVNCYWYLSHTTQRFMHNKGNITWCNGDIYLNSKDDKSYRYAIDNEGTGTINWKNGYIESYYGRGIININGEGRFNWEDGEIFSKYTDSATFEITNGDLKIGHIKYNYWVNKVTSMINAHGATSTTYGGDVTINDFEIGESKNPKSYECYAINGYPNLVIIDGGNFSGFKKDLGITAKNTYINGGTFHDPCTIGGTGHLYIEDGTLECLNITTGVSAYMTGGKIISTNNDTALSINNYSYFYFTNGSIENTKSNGTGVTVGTNSSFNMGENDKKVNVDTPIVKAEGFGVKNNNYFFFYDGIIQGNNGAISGSVVTPEKYKVNYFDENKIAQLTLDLEVENIVSIGNVQYASLDDAVLSANSMSKVSQKNVIINVNQDIIDLTSQIIIDEGADITVNLNGRSITYNGNDEAAFVNNGQLYIVDNSADGSGSVTTPSILQSTTGYAIQNYGTLTIGNPEITTDIETPSIKGKENAIDNHGTLVLNSGKVDDDYVERGEKIAPTSFYKMYNLARSKVFKAAKEIGEIISSPVVPIIKVDSELPEWTNQSVTATIYARKMVELEIIEHSPGEQEQPKGSYKLDVTKVSKVSESTKVSGAEFTIYEVKDGIESEIGTLKGKTNEEGKYESEDIPITGEGTINLKIRETVVPNGFLRVNDIDVTIHVTLNSEENRYVVDSIVAGTEQGEVSRSEQDDKQNVLSFIIREPECPEGTYKLDVTKVSKVDNSTMVPNAQFDLYEIKDDGETKIGSLTEKEEGKYESEDIPINSTETIHLKIKETVTPEGYLKVDDINVTLQIGLNTEGNRYVVESITFGTDGEQNGNIERATQQNKQNTISFRIEEPEEPKGTYKLDITKVSKQNRAKLIDGAVFKVYEVINETDHEVSTLTNNGEGKYESEEIPITSTDPIHVKIKEETSPEGYLKIDDMEGTIQVGLNAEKNRYEITSMTIEGIDTSVSKATQENVNNTVSFTIEEPEEPKGTYKLDVKKVSKQNSSRLIDGAEFELYEVRDEEGEVKVGTLSDVGEGKYESGEVPITGEGTIHIKIKETQIPDGFLEIEEIEGTIQVQLSEAGNRYEVTSISLGEMEGTIEKATQENKQNKISFTIQEPEVPQGTYKLDVKKVSKQNTSNLIDGAEFKIYEVRNGEDEEVGTLRSIGQGKYESDDINITSTGTINIKIKETEVPGGYLQIDDIIGTMEVGLSDAGNRYEVKSISWATGESSIQVATQENKQNKISFTIEEPVVPEGTYKLDVTKVSKQNETNLIEGAEFKIYEVKDGEETEVGTLANMGDGKYESQQIEIKNEDAINIRIRETTTPEGFLQVNDINATINVSLNDVKNRYVVESIVFESDEAEQGNIVKATQDSKQNVLNFTIKEPEVPEGTYKLDVTKVSKANNERKVTGAEFKIYEVKDGEEKEVGTLTDKGGGKYESEEIAITSEKEIRVKIKETKTPEGFLKIDDIEGTIEVGLNEAGNRYEVKSISLGGMSPSVDKATQENKQNRISFTIEEPEVPEGTYKLDVTKVSKTDNKKKVSGAEFTIYEVRSGENVEVGKLTETQEPGKYQSPDIQINNVGTIDVVIKETKIPEGYKGIADISGTLTIELNKEENRYIVKSTTLTKEENAITEATQDNLQNTLSFTIEEPEKDAPEGTYRLDVTKVSKTDSSKVVSGAEFDIYEVTDGVEEKVGTLTDKGNGKYESKDIEISDDGIINVVIKETKIPDGYEAVENISGTITVELDEEANRYVVVETSLGTVEDNATESAKNVLSFTIEEPEREGAQGTYKLDVTKVSDKDSTKYVAGAEFDIFEVRNNAETKVGTLTDKGNGKYESGEIQIENEGIIDVIVRETKVPEGYKAIDDIKGTITVELNEESNRYVVKETTLVSSQDSIQGATADNKQNKLSFTIAEPEQDPEIEKINYELLVRYTAGADKIDEAKIAVKHSGTLVEDYTKNGILKVTDINLAELGSEMYTIYETETPEYCQTIVSEEDPGLVTLTRKPKSDGSGNEFVADYDAREGFNVVIDDANRQVIFDITTEKNDKYDLALMKFISNIDGTAITDREPKIIVSDNGEISYEGNSRTEQASNNQNVTYTIRMYNQTEVKGKGKMVIEYVPDGLVFVPDNEINTKYGWVMFKADEDGNVAITENPEEADVVVTNYLVDKDIAAFNKESREVSYLDVQAVFRIDESKIKTDDRTIENKVQIMPNNNDDNTENDVTTEKIYVKYFDLSIEKYMEKVRVENKDGVKEEQIGYDRKGELIKVDVKKSRVNGTKITITYGLVVKNVGEIAGYATEVVDYMPEGFKLVEDGIWSVDGANVKTTSLSDVLLNPGDSTNVEVTFEWNLSEGSIGLKSNEAEIAKYTNEFDAVDLTQDNKDRQDMLVSIKTGSEVIGYISIGVLSIMIVAVGVVSIKRQKINE